MGQKVVVISRYSSQPHMQDFVHGLQRHNVDFCVPDSFDAFPSDGDMYVTWGYKGQPLVAEHCKENNVPHLVLEMGYIGDRCWWTSCGFNGINGEADFMPELADSARKDKYFDQSLLGKFGPRGNDCLILGQTYGDATHRDLVDIRTWLADECKAWQDRGCNVVFRPHPREARGLPDLPKGVSICGASSLSEALSSAAMAASFSSNSLVDAVIAGVPVRSYSKRCMAHEFNYSSAWSYDDQRQSWLNKIYYAQWNRLELWDGSAWEWLGQKIQ